MHTGCNKKMYNKHLSKQRRDIYALYTQDIDVLWICI